MNQQFRYGENDLFFQNAQNAGAVFPPAGCFTLFNLCVFICLFMYLCYVLLYFIYVFFIYYVVYLMYVYLYSFIDLYVYLYMYIYVQLQKYRTWSVQKWGMPATALQSLIHHPGTCVAGPAVPQASCNLVKMGRRVSPKVFSEKNTLLVRASPL